MEIVGEGRGGEVLAGAGEGAVGGYEFKECDLDVADGHAETEGGIGGVHVREAEGAEAGAEARDAGLLEKADEREIEREDERIAERDGAAMAGVEVRRAVAFEGHGNVREALFRGYEAAVHGKRGEEWLEGGAGGAGGDGGVDLSALAGEVVAAAGEGEDGAVGDAHYDGGGSGARRLRIRVGWRGGRRWGLGDGGDDFGSDGLDVRVEGGHDVAAAGIAGIAPDGAQRPVAVVRVEERAWGAVEDGLDGAGPLRLRLSEATGLYHAREDVFAALEGALRPSVGAKARRRLHHAREESRLAGP